MYESEVRAFARPKGAISSIRDERIKMSVDDGEKVTIVEYCLSSSGRMLQILGAAAEKSLMLKLVLDAG